MSVLNRITSKPLSAVGVFQSGLILVFILSYLFEGFPLVFLFRFVSGFLSLLLVPGIIVSSISVAEEHRNLAVSIVVGIVLQILLVQVLYLSTLLFGVQIPLFLWSTASTMVVFALCMLWMKWTNLPNSLCSAIRLDVHRHVLMIVVLGVILRMVLWFAAEGSIAPDAALYADFARSIMEGRFDSLVINDGAVNNITASFVYLTHHTFTYVFAISWLLAVPTTSGPTIILVLIGILLIFPTYTISKHFFGEQAATWASLIVSIHPLFVFHSAVAYGPEITTLLLIMYVGVLLNNGIEASRRSLVLAGVLIGLVESIWYANFYLFCVVASILPIFAAAGGRSHKFLFLVFLIVALLARMFYLYLPLFLTIWILLLVAVVCISKLRPSLMFQKALPFYVTILLTTLVWLLPSQIKATIAGSMSPSLGADPSPYILIIPGLQDTGMSFLQIPTIYLAPELLSTGIRFFQFLFIYLAPGFIIVLLMGLARGNARRESMMFVLAGFVAALGTIVALFPISDIFAPQYIFSSSRFSLFIILMMVLASGSFFSSRQFLSTRVIISDNRGKVWLTKNWKSVVVLGILGIGMVPGYLLIPSGIALVDVEERYGWNGLPSLIESIGSSDTRFLVDRAREFSWFTGRESVVLTFSGKHLGVISASAQVLSLSRYYNASYLVMDAFTLAHWDVFEYLVRDSLTIGHSVVLDHAEAIKQRLNNFTTPIESFILVGETQPNMHGKTCRIFQRSSASFVRVQDIQLTNTGWNASNGGNISNSSGEIRLTVGPEANYTNTWRPNAYDLNLDIDSGYLVFAFEDAGAIIARIEIYDSGGSLVSYADRVNDELYYCPFGELKIGDIRIVIEGNPGDSVIVQSISAWDVI